MLLKVNAYKLKRFKKAFTKNDNRGLKMKREQPGILEINFSLAAWITSKLMYSIQQPRFSCRNYTISQNVHSIYFLVITKLLEQQMTFMSLSLKPICSRSSKGYALMLSKTSGRGIRIHLLEIIQE